MHEICWGNLKKIYQNFVDFVIFKVSNLPWYIYDTFTLILWVNISNNLLGIHFVKSVLIYILKILRNVRLADWKYNKEKLESIELQQTLLINYKYFALLMNALGKYKFYNKGQMRWFNKSYKLLLSTKRYKHSQTFKN